MILDREITCMQVSHFGASWDHMFLGFPGAVF